jgi:hypothetical protein
MVTTVEHLKQIIIQTSDTYIRHYESELKVTQEKAKLSLWIIGLSIGIELFVLNKVERSILGNTLSVTLFLSVTLIFLFNALFGLLIRLKQTRLFSHFHTVITMYDYQKNTILLNANEPEGLWQQIIVDFEKGEALNKLNNLEYINEKETKHDKLSSNDLNFLLRSENIPSSLLVIQVILTIFFSIHILFD